MYTNGAPQGAVKEFLDFVLSAEGQKMLKKQGLSA
jgi:ABC-type Fe3+ transport system substrate-binding protein